MNTNQLFTSDSDSDLDDKNVINTNKDYAKSYNKFREKELLKKLKDKHLNSEFSDDDDDDAESSADDSSDDDNGQIINSEFDKEFFKTLASLKTKDPKIYDKQIVFFNNDADNVYLTKDKKKQKKDGMTVKDFERKVMLEKGGHYVDDDIDEHSKNTISKSSHLPYVQEQNLLKDEFKKIITSDDSDAEGNWGGIFKIRDKTKTEVINEEDEYTKWLAGENAANVGENATVLKPLKDYWSNPKLSKDETFLRDYILNNGYNNRDENDIPTYDEVTRNFDSNKDILSDDERELEKQETFEYKYNFRFEEPDKEFIKRYPRTIEHSVRKTDDRRKIKRLEKKENKQREKEEQKKELEKLKELKRNEIEEKIQTLKQVSGIDKLPFKEEELDDDFDPDEYDKKMEEIFDNEYYQIDEGDEKPECPPLDDLQTEDWDNYNLDDNRNVNGDDDENVNEELHCEDNEFNMDCDYDKGDNKKSFQNELIESTRDRRKRKAKRKSVFMEMLQSKKPIFDPNDEKTYSEYIDEYYKLDYEDIIAGDIKCRYKYVETIPNDFGLSVSEILTAKNKELNQWASLKKAIQYRPEYIEKNEVKMYQLKSKNDNLKKKILRSLYETGSDEDLDENEGDKIIKDNISNIKKKRKNHKMMEFTVDDGSKCKNRKSFSNGKESNDSKNITIEAENNDDSCTNNNNNNSKIKVVTLENYNNYNIIEQEEKLANKDKALVDQKTTPHFETNKMLPIEKRVKAKLETNQHKLKIEKLQQANKLKIFKSKQIIKKNKNENNAKIINVSSDKLSNKLNPKNKKQLKKKLNTNNSYGDLKISDDRLRAFGINPKKYHNKLKYNKNNGFINNNNNNKYKNNINKINNNNKNKNFENKITIKKIDNINKDKVKNINKLKTFLNKSNE